MELRGPSSSGSSSSNPALFAPLIDHDYDTVFEHGNEESDYKEIHFTACESTLFNAVHIDVDSSMTEGLIEIWVNG